MNSGADNLCLIVLGMTVALLCGQALSRLTVGWRNRRRKRRDEDVETVVKPADASTAAQTKTDSSGTTAAHEKPSEGPQMPDRLRHGVAHECAAHARAAFANGVLVESYYFGSIARLCGHRLISTLLGQVRHVWRRTGCPTEKELIYEGFSDVESAIGRAMLRIDCGIDVEMGYACLTDLANDGNEIAQDLLKSLPANPFASENPEPKAE